MLRCALPHVCSCLHDGGTGGCARVCVSCCPRLLAQLSPALRTVSSAVSILALMLLFLIKLFVLPRCVSDSTDKLNSCVHVFETFDGYQILPLDVKSLLSGNTRFPPRSRRCACAVRMIIFPDVLLQDRFGGHASALYSCTLYQFSGLRSAGRLAG